jgi:hypothetical protein
MKEYPHMMGPNKAPRLHCIAFEKYDGSNMRFEWGRKNGWWKSGRRHGLVDDTHELGQAIELFGKKYAEPIEKAIMDSRKYRNAERVIAFAEFFGPNSFAGRHDPNDEKDLMLFDVFVHKKGFVGPRDFLRMFGEMGVARPVYEGMMNDTLINDVRKGRYGVKEGVVCKAMVGDEMWMWKIKTLAYMERLKGAFANGIWQRYWE